MSLEMSLAIIAFDEFQKTDMPKPREGSVLDLIGFSVADLDAPRRSCSPAARGW
jgi:hypothetical protein